MFIYSFLISFTKLFGFFSYLRPVEFSKSFQVSRASCEISPIFQSPFGQLRSLEIFQGVFLLHGILFQVSCLLSHVF